MEEGSPDDISPAEFVKKIREMGEQRDREDAARFAKLEQDIYRDREQRAARRAERARSISPEKSATSTPTSLRREYTPSPVQDRFTQGGEDTEESRPTPTSIGRSGTLSWQQRPSSMSNRRPLSMLAAENAARSPRLSPDRTAADENEDLQNPSRAQIAESLASRDPGWFRQTADRGLGSAAYRRSREDSAEVPASFGKHRLTGMVGTSNRVEEELPGAVASTTATRRPTSPMSALAPTLAGAMRSTAGWNNTDVISADTTTQTSGSAKSLMDAPKLTAASESRQYSRPTSPTKGMGGFVQSAMMKRSDSVSKRWSTQAGPGLSRQSSTASNRGHRDGGLSGSSSMPRLDSGASISPSRGTSPVSRARPTSSHEDSSLSATRLSNVDDDDDKGQIIKQTQSLHGRSKSVASLRSNAASETGDTVAPSSPTKRYSRSPTKSSWLESALNKPEEKPKFHVAPTQPAWMVSLSKAKAQKESLPADDTLKFSSATFDQEVDLNTANKPSEDPFVAAKAKSPPPEPASKPIALTKEHSAPAVLPSSTRSSPNPPPKPALKSFDINKQPILAQQTDFRANLRSRQAPNDNEKNVAPEFLGALGKLRKAKTENYVAPDILKGNILQGKAALTITGGPKPRERVDELKESLVKQKEAIKEKAAIEGPRKSSREVKPSSTPEALAKRQQLGGASAFKDPLLERKTQDAVPPEFLTRQRTMKEKNRPEVGQKPAISGEKTGLPIAAGHAPKQSGSSTTHDEPADAKASSSDALPAISKSDHSSSPALGSPPMASFINGSGLRPGASSKLANRFNPALAGILSRGPSPLAVGRPPPLTEDSNMISSPAHSTRAEAEQSSKELTHMTKGRARGPKRKAPTSKTSAPLQTEAVETSSSTSISAGSGRSQAPSQEAISSVYEVPLVKKAYILPSSPTATSVPSHEETFKSKPSVSVKSPQLSSRIFTPTKPISLVAESDKQNPVPQDSGRTQDITSFTSETSDSSATKTSPSITQKPTKIITQRTVVNARSRIDDFTPPQSADGAGPKANLWGKPVPHLSAEVREDDALPTSSGLPNQASAGSKSTKRSGSPEREDDDLSMVSVKNAMSTWGRQSGVSGDGQKRARSPIKLPTKEDEDRINREAGLVRDADGSHSSRAGAVGLGLLADPAANDHGASVSSSSRSTTLFPLSPPLSAGLPLLPDHNTAVDTEGPSSRHKHVDHDKEMSPRTRNDDQFTSRDAESRFIKTPDLRARPMSLSFKMPESPIPMTSEANRIFAVFFDDRPFFDGIPIVVDVENIISASPPKYEKIKTIRKMIHEVSADGKMLPVPTQQEHILFEESMYLVIHVYQSRQDSRLTSVYLWVGAGVTGPSADEAILLGRKVAKDYGSRLTLIRQGKESSFFFQAIGGILVTFRGQRRTTTRTGLPKTFMLCARKQEGNIAVDEVDFVLDNFCSGFAFIVCSNSRLYLWKGKGCHAEELGCARLIAMDLASSLDFIEVEEGKEPESLLRVFPDSSRGSTQSSSANKSSGTSEFWSQKSKYERYRCRLFRISQPVIQTSPSSKNALQRQESTASSTFSMTSGKTRTTPTQEFTTETPSTPTRERSSVSSLLYGWGSAASNAAGTMVRKKSWSSVIPLNITITNSPTRTSTPTTPITPNGTGTTRPSSRGGYFSTAVTAGGGLLGFRRKDSEDLTSTFNNPPHQQPGDSELYSTHTFKASNGCTVEEITLFSQSDLTQEGIFILDSYFSITILVRPLCRNQRKAFVTALLFAQDYAILAASNEDRPFIPLGRVLIEKGGGGGNGIRDRDFIASFRGWSSERERRDVASVRMERGSRGFRDGGSRDRDGHGIHHDDDNNDVVVVGLSPALSALRML